MTINEVTVTATRIRRKRVELHDKILTVQENGVAAPEFFDPAAALLFKMLLMEPVDQSD
ncbi:MAG: hypothetical protein FWG69_03740 [Oscillospiraceae bacterium]|nr:hypothetical protein [Oscillospiraceae bacterium]